MTPGARAQAAIDLLDAIAAEAASGGLPADRVVQGFFRARRYAGSKDRRAITDIAYAVLRRRAQLDWWIARHGLQPASRTRVLTALVSCLVNPADAVVAMAGADRYSLGALDDAERAMVEALPCGDPDDPGQPDWVRANVPEWLAPELEAGLGSDWPAEAAALAVEAPVDLRANTLRGGREAARRALAKEGIEAAPTSYAPHGLRLTGRVNLQGTRAWKDGLVEPQDEASQLVALLVEAAPGEAVCDFCAGGGGKTLALAASMAGQGRIAACDAARSRLDAMLPRLARAGVGIVATHLVPNDAPDGPFDRVLVDAPCSGSGAWRRNPDARWRLAPEDLDALAALQADILDTAATLVRPGGRLVYATCSLLGRENRAQVDAFLARDPAFRIEPVDAILARLGLDRSFAQDPHFLATPARHGTDGFFAAVMTRAA